jgi:dolichol-phosphate mannosyltransferase
MHSIKFVSVLLPTYNESGNIADLILAIDSAIVHPHEIIVVDDNSPDGTSLIVQQMIATEEVACLRLQTRTEDRGLTKSLQAGIDMAEGDVLVWMDCDFSMPPAKIPELLARVEEGVDIAVGSRFISGGGQKDHDIGESRFAIILSSVLNAFLRFALGSSFHDYTSGFIAIRSEVLQDIHLYGDYGEYFMDLICRAKIQNRSIEEISYYCVARRSGESKTAPNIRVLVRRGIKYLAMVVRIWVLRLTQKRS